MQNSDTIMGMIYDSPDAMFFYIVTMGFLGILMAWEVVVLAIRGAIIRKEDSHEFRGRELGSLTIPCANSAEHAGHNF